MFKSNSTGILKYSLQCVNTPGKVFLGRLIPRFSPENATIFNKKVGQKSWPTNFNSIKCYFPIVTFISSTCLESAGVKTALAKSVVLFRVKKTFGSL